MTDANNNTPPVEPVMAELVRVFFGEFTTMQRSISILCESNTKQHTDTVTSTVLAMLTTHLQIYLTAVGWQPFKSKDLTYPYAQMTSEQKAVFRAALTGSEAPGGEGGGRRWGVFEHAMAFRRPLSSPPIQLRPLDVLSALCGSVLNSHVYHDKRLRVAVCNILLQRVQASIPLDKHTQAALNERLFPVSAPATPETKPEEEPVPLRGSSPYL